MTTRQRQADEQHSIRMAPYIAEIYEQTFPGVQILTARDAFAESIRAYGLEAEAGKIAEWLDRDLAIDKVLKLPDGATFTVQEKVRRHYATQYMDFTQEYLNGAGTEYENLGEWFKLNAQLYFYGWSNEEENAIPKWAIIDIVQYKRLVADAGGLDRIGDIQQNHRHGTANFFAIPIQKMAPSFIAQSPGLV